LAAKPQRKPVKKKPRKKTRAGITLADIERSRAALSQESKLRDEFHETLGLLYVALATAYGGGDMLDDANASSASSATASSPNPCALPFSRWCLRLAPTT
jgi:hypothetical protein